VFLHQSEAMGFFPGNANYSHTFRASEFGRNAQRPHEQGSPPSLHFASLEPPGRDDRHTFRAQVSPISNSGAPAEPYRRILIVGTDPHTYCCQRGRKHLETAPSPLLPLRPDATLLAVTPSTSLRGFRCLCAKLESQPFYSSCDTARRQVAVPSNMVATSSNGEFVELWMGQLP
jgi:hypothetical protein